MKLFYYFQELHSNMFQWQRVHIVNELEHHGVEVFTFNPLSFSTTDEANEASLEILKNDRFDLFFTNVGYHKMLYPETVDRIRQMGIPTVCFRCDNLVIPYNDKILAPHFDLVWLTSVETQWMYEKWGCKTIFLPYAANPYAFAFEPSDIIKKVCFVGTPYGSRSRMINNLTNNGILVDAYCKPNPNITIDQKVPLDYQKSSIVQMGRIETLASRLRFPEGRKLIRGSIVNKLSGKIALESNECLFQHYFVTFDKISSLYSQYSLCLSSTSTNHTDALKAPLKVVNLRAFEIPMSGGITLCKYNPELAGYFAEDEEAIYYRTNEEMIDKARYYTTKASEAELKIIKENARKKAESDHTWWNRFSNIFSLLNI